MIRVTVELLPGGYETNKRKLAQVYISNDCTGTRTRGNYCAKLWRRRFQPWRTTEVKDFPRTRLGALDLLYRVLKASVADRNP